MNRNDNLDSPEADNTAGGAFGGGPTNRVLGFSKRTKIILGTTVVAVIVALTVFLAFQYITPHYTVSELLFRPVTPAGQFIAVEGVLVPESFSQTPDGKVSTFRLIDQGGNDTVLITYGTQTGADIGQVFFNQHSTILVQGRKTSQSDFEATRLTVKCPSKYQTDDANYEDTYTSDA